MKKRATKRHGLIEPVEFATRPIVERLEQRRLFNIAGAEFSGPGSIQEGQAATFQIFASTDHDWLPGTQVHAHIDWGDGTAPMDMTWTSAQQMNLYHVYTEANPNAVTASATIWDDPVATYNISSSSVYETTDVQVDEAPLSSVPATNITSFFDVSDPENIDTSPRAVAQFADANPYAEPGDFTVVSIDWGDGSPIDYGGGGVQKDVNGNFDVMGYHPYFAPNPDPASDGSYLVHAVVMEPIPGGGSGDGEFVDAFGKAMVHAKLWINATAGTTPPAQQKGVDCSNSNITITLPAGATSWSGPINLQELAGSPPPPTFTTYTPVAWVGTPAMRVTSATPGTGISWLPAAAATGTPASVWVENMTVTGITAGTTKFTLAFSDSSGAKGTVTVSFK